MDIQGEIRPLTGLRFVAAFWVFLFHMQIRWPFTDFGPSKAILDKGALGMSLFFMLSGFILSNRYIKQLNLRQYILNRIARIYPIYVTAAILTLPWIGVHVATENFSNFIRSIGRLVFLVAANIILIQAWFPQMFSLWNDGGSWSISTEAFFYALLPILLPALVALRNSKLWLVIGICWLASFLPGISEFFFKYNGALPFYSVPIYRLPEFIIGIAIFLLISRGVTKLPFAANWAIIVMFAVYLASPIPAFNYVGHNWIAVPVMGLCIFTLALAKKGIIFQFLGSAPMEWLGKISYCFYSFQAIIILFLLSYHDAIVRNSPLLSNNGLLTVAAFSILLCASAAGYHLIEEPCRKALRGFSVRSASRHGVVPDFEEAS